MSKKAINKQKRNYRFTGLILGLLLLLPSLIQLGHLLEGHQHLGCNQNSTHLHELDHKCDVLAFHFSALSFSFNESTEEEKLVDFVQEKVDNLEKYYDKIVSADVYLKVENTSDKENKIFEVKLSVPGDSFVVKKQCKTFEEGADMATFSLERQLKKRKEKLSSHL